ncbi:MAG TPA: AcvB/VirJ family lysyl-phosphatidylglycerol hydrolase [Candidatus Binataceae bacterium]|nr:AcvB/VirJ family lysyl-phosphatidylglycerol hydrolase [Candidatus Binataceae bacterium]
MIGLWLLSVLLAALMAGCSGGLPVQRISGGRYGSVKMVKPNGPSNAFILLFSDRAGLTKAGDAAAQMLAKRGALVVEIDTPAYLKQLDKKNESCYGLVIDAEGFSRLLERENHFPNYLAPILAGLGEAGTLAQVILSAAPPVTIAGAVSIDPSATLAGQRPICTGVTTRPAANGFSYGPALKLQGFWTVGFTANAAPSSRDYVSSLRRAGMPLDLYHLAAGSSLGDELWKLIEPHIAAAINVARLPLTILPVAKPSKLMAVVISGDGGWRDLDRTIAEYLQGHGVPVVGWDSLRYFWTKKTPEQTSDQLAAILTTYISEWHAPDVALIGYSFGADVMPFAYNRLPPNLRSHIKLIALLGLAHSADFRIVIYGWLGASPSSEALPLVPQLNKIPAALIQCYYGQNEADTACPAQAARGVEVIRRPGGHHFDGKYDIVAASILKGFKTRVADDQENQADEHGG